MNLLRNRADERQYRTVTEEYNGKPEDGSRSAGRTGSVELPMGSPAGRRPLGNGHRRPLALGHSLATSCTAAEARNGYAISPPPYRIETDGFGASERDIRAVLDSGQPGIVAVLSGVPDRSFRRNPRPHGPITLHQRNERGEIVIRLDTGKTYWAQYAYQFAHEFCHVLCGYRNGYQGNQCSRSPCAKRHRSTHCGRWPKGGRRPALRALADFRDALRDYADTVVRKHDKLFEIYAKGVPDFYRAHRAELERTLLLAS